ncbi:potassium transporter TrkG [Nitrosomonas sp. ANs5]|uniref:potassium transporter TrkG n=1 Tax=Nitrosomonas sp. ANs5 TaxID=3423941 RepID=UPI003D32CF9F
MLSFLRPVIYVCGILLLITAGLMLCVGIFAWIQSDPELTVFMLSAAITVIVGMVLVFGCRTSGFNLVVRQLYLLTSVSWLMLSLAGALPLYLSDFEIGFVDALFEAVSGITTTGSTIMSSLETLPPSLLLWRSMLQWLGGLGVIGMAVSILPFLRVGGMRLFQTESSDWSDKSMPRIQTLARMLVFTYLSITLACLLCYWFAGMTLFDAVNHAMTTVSTGGYATDDRSMGRFESHILWIAIVFMVLGALPFTVIISFVRQPNLSTLKNQQMVGLLVTVMLASLLLTCYLIGWQSVDLFDAVTQSTFNLVSVITTTGYASTDYTLWGNFSIALFFVVMFIGGCSGSTSGGMKVFRFQLSYLFLRNQIRKLIHPGGVFVTQYNGKPVAEDITLSVIAFSFLFFLCLAVITLLLAMMGLDLVTSLSAAATALTNVGPGLGDVIGPAGNFASLPETAKLLLSFAMLLGRLELLTIMVLFTPIFWRGREGRGSMLKMSWPSRKNILSYSLPWMMPMLATGASLSLASVLSAADLVLIYLAAVLVTAVSTRVKPALFSAMVSFLAYNFFFTEPYYSLRMLHQEDILTALLLVMVALITGHLAARLNEQVAALRDSERWSRQQMNCANALSICVDGPEIIKAFTGQLGEALNWQARQLENEELQSPIAVSDVTWHGDESGVTVIFSGNKGELAGAIRLSATEQMDTWHRERLDVLVNLARLAWSRVQLAESLKQETLEKEREQLRSALLSSVSHDLRTPLAAMIGSVSSLIDLAGSLNASQRNELLMNTLSEARRLDRYIQKLLDMARLGQGELPLERDWIGLDDIVSVVVRRVRPLLQDIELKFELPPDLPLLHAHPALIEQALFNVLENAVRFSPSKGVIGVSARHENGWLHIDVHDAGPGIAAADHERVFDMFHTFSHGDQYSCGTGLGLPICRSIMAAHGGWAEVLESEPDKGTTLRLSLPLRSVLPEPKEEEEK